MKRFLLTLLLLSLMTALGACGKDDDKAAETATAVAQATVTAAARSEGTPEPAAATPRPAVSPSQAGESSGPTVAQVQLASSDLLDSFRSLTQFSYEGTNQGGQQEEVAVEVRTAYTKDPLARQISMTATEPGGQAGNENQPEVIEFYQIEDAFYAGFGEEWVQISAEDFPFNTPQAAFLVDGSVLFSDLASLARAQPNEVVNGIASEHYTFDEDNLSGYLNLQPADQVKVTGNLWIAADGGYVTRYVMDAEVEQGSGGLLAPELAQGTLHMAFELSEVNGDIVIELPEEARSTMTLLGFDENSPFPRPEGASVAIASAEFTVIQTNLSPEEVQTFYEKALATLGWTKDEEASMTLNETTNLSFTRQELQLTINLAADPNTGLTTIMAGVQQIE